MMDDDAFMRDLRATFAVEARELLQALSRGLVGLEDHAGDPAVRIEPVFRAAHSLKGAARAVELHDVESLCQLIEDILARHRKEHRPLPSGATHAVQLALDVMEVLTAADPPARAPPLQTVRRELRRWVVAVDAVDAAVPTETVEPNPASSRSTQAAPVLHAALPVECAWPVRDETVRVAVPKLEAQLLKNEELLASKLAAQQRLQQMRAFETWFETWRTHWVVVEAELRQLRRVRGIGDAGPARQTLMRVLDFCEWSDGAVRMLEGRMGTLGHDARRDQEAAGRSIEDALAHARRLLLLPFSTLSAAMPRLVRELCRSVGKEAELVVDGEQIELDKRILEGMKDPLLHLLRNAVDHGVETPSQRQASGKPPVATLKLIIEALDAQRVRIAFEDDGGGIALDRVRASAVRGGMMSQEEADRLDDAAVRALVFRSSLSTGSAQSTLSGRGLGLAIVQEHVQRLGGEVGVHSTPGRGTRFEIVLPATRSASRAVLCEVAGRAFLLPTSAVERVTRVRADAVRCVDGRDAVLLCERMVSLWRLAQVLGLPDESANDATYLQLVIINTADQPLAFVVDEVREEREVLVRALPPLLQGLRHVSAAAELGSGALVPVLEPVDLIATARQTPHRVLAGVPNTRQAPIRTKTVLVAEDSITSRLLLQTILQSAGYAVKTAVDGVDALATLRTEPCDLLVSDVEMPRLDGFGLTTRIRTDRRLSDLPVVLVTALATREDRERGVEAGADAYIAKGGFDQQTLLATVQRLIG